MTTFSERAALLDQAAYWTLPETFDAMAALAVASAREWAEAAFLAIHEDDRATWTTTAGTATLNLIADTERLADFLEATPEQRRALIAERVGVFKSRLEEMLSAPSAWGTA